MRRIVVDTNIYIDWLNARQHEAVLFQQGTVKYLSAIVLMELQAGAFSAQDQRLLRQLTRAFMMAGRVLLPSAHVYEAAGHVLRGLQSTHGYNVSTAGSLNNDVLIALSARSIGATVVTQNESDFRAIQSVRRFKLELVG